MLCCCHWGTWKHESAHLSGQLFINGTFRAFDRWPPGSLIFNGLCLRNETQVLNSCSLYQKKGFVETFLSAGSGNSVRQPKVPAVLRWCFQSEIYWSFFYRKHDQVLFSGSDLYCASRAVYFHEPEEHEMGCFYLSYLHRASSNFESFDPNKLQHKTLSWKTLCFPFSFGSTCSVSKPPLFTWWVQDDTSGTWPLYWSCCCLVIRCWVCA